MAPFWVDCPSRSRMLEYRNSWPTSRAAILLWYCRSAATSYSTDGRYTADDIVEKVAGEITPAEVYYGLGLLEKKSYITEADSTIPPDRAAF